MRNELITLGLSKEELCTKQIWLVSSGGRREYVVYSRNGDFYYPTFLSKRGGPTTKYSVKDIKPGDILIFKTVPKRNNAKLLEQYKLPNFSNEHIPFMNVQGVGLVEDKVGETLSVKWCDMDNYKEPWFLHIANKGLRDFNEWETPMKNEFLDFVFEGKSQDIELAFSLI